MDIIINYLGAFTGLISHTRVLISVSLENSFLRMPLSLEWSIVNSEGK